MFDTHLRPTGLAAVAPQRGPQSGPQSDPQWEAARRTVVLAEALRAGTVVVLLMSIATATWLIGRTPLTGQLVVCGAAIGVVLAVNSVIIERICLAMRATAKRTLAELAVGSDRTAVRF